MLLYLNKNTWTSDPRLADEVRLVMARGGKIVMAHENDTAYGGCAFDTFLQTTPQELIDGGLYAPLAIALHAGDEHRAVSKRLLAVALGARVIDPRTVRCGNWLVPTATRMRAPTALLAQLLSRRSKVSLAMADGDDGLPQLEMRSPSTREGS
jgi:hypothetical protein